MIKRQSKQDLSKGPPVCAASNRGDPPWMLGVRGDPSFKSGSRGKPPELKNGYDRVFEQVLIFKDIDGNYCPNGRIMPGRIEKIGKGNKWRATAEEAVQYHEMGYNNSGRGCVRVDYYPEESLTDFRNEGAGKGREGFHRAPTTVITAASSLRATEGSVASCHEMGYNNSGRGCVRVDYYPEESLKNFRREGESRGREGFHRAPTTVITAASSLRTTEGSVASCHEMGYDNSGRGCVRVDYCPEESLTDFRNEGAGKGREGFHRAPTMVTEN